MDDFFKTATVITVHPHTTTCDILKTEGGMLYAVPVANISGGLQSTDVSWGKNLRGAVVYYTHINNAPYILGTLPQNNHPARSVGLSPTATGSGSDNATTYGAGSAQSFSDGRNTAYMPGDKVFSSDGGAELALLAEGLAVLKASPLAQIVLGGLMDFVRIVSREFSIITDFGELKFAHGSSGRTGLSIVGGAAYGDEARPGEGSPTVHMYLGDTPEASDSRFGVRVNSTDGGDYGAVVMGKDGRLALATSKNSLLSVGEDNEVRVNGNDYQQIDATRTTEIGGKEHHTVMQERHVSVGAGERHATGGDFHLQVGGALVIGADSMRMDATAGGGSGAMELRCSSFNIVKA